MSGNPATQQSVHDPSTPDIPRKKPDLPNIKTIRPCVVLKNYEGPWRVSRIVIAGSDPFDLNVGKGSSWHQVRTLCAWSTFNGSAANLRTPIVSKYGVGHIYIGEFEYSARA